MGLLLRHLPKVCLGGAAILFGLAAWAYFAETAATGNALVVDRSLLDEVVQQPLEPGNHPVTLRVRNTSNRPQRVVGFTPT